MNRTSRTEEPYEGDGLNQSPNPLSRDLTTNQDFIGVVNSREQKDAAHQTMSQCDPPPDAAERSNLEPSLGEQGTARTPTNASGRNNSIGIGQPGVGEELELPLPSRSHSHGSSTTRGGEGRDCTTFQRVKNAIIKFGSFVGPGFMIAVAYSE